MPRLRWTPSSSVVSWVCLLAALLACGACSYESGLSSFQCDELGAREGDRECVDGIWVTRRDMTPAVPPSDMPTPPDDSVTPPPEDMPSEPDMRTPPPEDMRPPPEPDMRTPPEPDMRTPPEPDMRTPPEPDMRTPPEPDMRTCPADPCAPGEAECRNGNELWECVMNGMGCMIYQTQEICGTDRTCDAFQKACVCDETCTPNDRRCSINDDVEVCVEPQQSGTCPTWEIAQDCEGSRSCRYTGTAFICQCESSSFGCTTDGEVRCKANNDNQLITCGAKDPQGCFPDAEIINCSDLQQCVNGSCQDCPIQCVPGTQDCDPMTGDIRNCIQQTGDTCPSWSAPLGDCPNPSECASNNTGCTNSSQCAKCGSTDPTCNYCPGTL